MAVVRALLLSFFALFFAGCAQQVIAHQQTERDANKMVKILKDQGITWRNAIDGSTSGPLATKWNVQGWPTIYVIDATGKIRFKNVRDEEMEKAVMELLAEAKKR